MQDLKSALDAITSGSETVPKISTVAHILRCYQSIRDHSVLTLEELVTLSRIAAGHQRLPWLHMTAVSAKNRKKTRIARIRMNVEIAKLLHADILKLTPEIPIPAIDAFMTVSSQSGDTKMVHKWFDVLKDRDAATWQSYWMVINAYCQTSDMQSAEEWLKKLREDLCTDNPGIRVMRTMISGYLAISDVDNALRLFEEFKVHCEYHTDIKIYGQLLAALVKSAKYEQARSFFRFVMSSNLCPDDFCWQHYIMAHGDLNVGDGSSLTSQILEEMKAADYVPNGQAYAALVRMHLSRNDVRCAWHVFDIVPSPLAVSEPLFHAYLKTLLFSGHPDDISKAVELVKRSIDSVSDEIIRGMMEYFAKRGDVCGTTELCVELFKSSREPSKSVYDALMQAYARVGHVENVWRVYQIMRDSGVAMHRKTFNILLYAVTKNPIEAAKVFRDAVSGNLTISETLSSTRSSDMQPVYFILEEMKRFKISAGVDTYNIILAFVTQNHDFDAGLKLLKDFPAAPDTVTYTILLHAYVRTYGHCESSRALSLVSPMLNKSDTRVDDVLFSSLLHLLSKSESNLNTCRMLFDDMRERGVFPTTRTFDTLLHAFSRHENVGGAIWTYKTMITHGVAPSIFTFTHLISAFQRKYTPEPRLKLLIPSQESRESIQEFDSTPLGAFEAIILSNMKPDVIAFGALISAYGKRGDFNGASAVFNAMKEYGVEPNTQVYYALMKAAEHDGDRLAEVVDDMERNGVQPDEILMISIEQTHPTFRMQEKITVGAALGQLLNLPEKALRDACSCYEKSVQNQNTPLLKSLSQHIKQYGSDGAAAIYQPIKEKLLKTDQSLRQRSLYLASWLWHGTCFEDFLTLIVKDLSSKDKKLMLAAALILDYVVREELVRAKLNKFLAEGVDVQRLIRTMEVLPPLASILQTYGTIDEESGTFKHTRLTALTTTVCFDLLQLVIKYVESQDFDSLKDEISLAHDHTISETEEHEDVMPFVSLLWSLAPVLSDILQSMKQYKSGNAPFNVGIGSARNLIFALTSNPTSISKTNLKLLLDLLRALHKSAHPNIGRIPTEKFTTVLMDCFDNRQATYGFLIILPIVLCVSQRTPSDIETLLERNDGLEQDLYDLSCEAAMASKDDGSRALGFALLRYLITYSGPEKVRHVVEPLLNMLDEDPKDEMSSKDTPLIAVAGLLAEYAVKCPQDILGELFVRLSASQLFKRQNALVVLREILEINKDFILQDGPQNKLYREILTEKLLHHLHDEDLGLRKQSCQVFAALEPVTIIPRLAKLLENKDDRVRSAAEESLVNVLATHRAKSEAVIVYLDYARDITIGIGSQKLSVPRKPSDIHALHPHDANSNDTPRIERLLQVVKRWAKVNDPISWPPIACRMALKFYAAPTDKCIVQFMTAMAEHWTSQETTMALMPKMVKLMVDQPLLEPGMLATESDVEVQATKDLLYARLSPMLSLKVLPYRSFEILTLRKGYSSLTYWKEISHTLSKYPEDLSKVDSEAKIHTLAEIYIDNLLKRLEHPLEFDNVRRIAAELLGKLPIDVIEMIVQDKFTSAMIINLRYGALYVFFLCNAIAVHQLKIQRILPKVIPWLFKLLSIDNDLPDLMKLQAGCIECLAILIVLYTQTLKPPSTKKPMIVEIMPGHEPIDTGSDNHSNLNSILELWGILIDPLRLKKGERGNSLLCQQVLSDIDELMQREGREIAPLLSTGMSNTITTAIRRLSSSSDSQPDSDRAAVVSWLSKTILPSLLETASGQIRSERTFGSSIMASAALQAVLHVVYYMKVDIGNDIGDVIDVSISGIKSLEASVRLGSIKLLSACFAIPFENLREMAGPIRMLQVQRAVERMLAVESDPPTKDIAQKLQNAIFAMI
ncbi:hypothetical protein HDV05_008545 [Chytridiales sp. JEL 0842]|nr:hypothetical protein HDV05_008545 [Chytridiales sp. JEL 0842]